MKNIITLLLILFAFGATAQNHAGKSEMVIIDNSGESFYLIINKVVQNVVPKKQLKIVGLPATYHDIQLLYTNGNIVQVKEHVTLLPFKQYTAFVTWMNGQKRLEWIEVTAVNQSNYGKNTEMIMYTTPYNVTCYWCTSPNAPGYHYHADGTVHSNYPGNVGNHQGGNNPQNGITLQMEVIQTVIIHYQPYNPLWMNWRTLVFLLRKWII